MDMISVTLQCAQATLARGDAHRAMTLLDAALAEYPENAMAHVTRAQGLLKLGKTFAASRAVDAALSLAPEMAHAYVLRALTDTKLDKDTGAQEALKMALVLDPQDADNHVAIGLAFWLQKRYEDAQDAALSALALEPENAQAHEVLALVEFHRRPLTGWFHRLSFMYNALNLTRATLIGAPLLLLYMTIGDVADVLGMGDAFSMLAYGVLGVFTLMCVNVMQSERQAQAHQAQARLKLDY